MPKLEKIACIYCIINNADGNFYIGSTSNFRRRKSLHLYELRRNNHYNYKILKAYNEFGEDNFEFSILEVLEADKNILEQREQNYINCLKPKYNILPTAYSNLGFKFPEHVKKKMSESRRGKKKKKMSKESRENISKGRMGVKLSLEQRLKISGVNAHFYGKKHSEETKKKMSENNYFKGKRFFGPENGFYGKKHTEESRRKMSEAAKKRALDKKDKFKNQ